MSMGRLQMFSLSRFSFFGRRAHSVSNNVNNNPKKKLRKNVESKVRDVLAARIHGSRTEIPCSAGIVDIVTPKEIIEVKRAPLWKAAMGQALAYSQDFPDKTPRVHLFGPEAEHFRLAAVTCERFGVRLTASDSKGRDVDVWLGDRHRKDVTEVPGCVFGNEAGCRRGLSRGIETPVEDRNRISIENRATNTNIESS